MDDVAERRCLERPFVLFLLRDFEASQIWIVSFHPDTQVVVLLVGEVSTGMTGGAVRFSGEQLHAPLRRLAHRILRSFGLERFVPLFQCGLFVEVF